MALIWRVTVKWGGGNIGQGFTNMFFTEGVSTAQLAADAVKAFFTGVYGSTGADLPTGVTLTFPAGVDVLDPGSGLLTTTIPVTPGSSVTGIQSGNYASPAGACVTWLTAGVIAGKRVRGRTFLVPLASTGLANDGTLSSTAVTNIQAAGAALIAAAPEFCIWHRPGPGPLDVGSSHPVLALRLADKVAVLTSRR